MSLIYCKSQQYLMDTDNRVITSNEGSLPYSFTNEFKEPIVIKPNNKIELVSADLTIDPNYKISTLEKNNAITFGIGSKNSGSLQKVVRLTDGEYNEPTLANEIQSQMNKRQNLDMAEWEMDYNNLDDGEVGANKFKLLLKNQPRLYGGENDYQTNNVKYEVKTSKMGFDETTARQDLGVGTSLNEMDVLNFNNIENSFSTIVTKKYTPLANTTRNNTKDVLLINSALSTKNNGLMTACGNFNTIITPKHHYLINPTTFLSGSSATILFDLKKDGSIISGFNDLKLEAYSGSNLYDMKANNGTNVVYLKFITAATGGTAKDLDFYTLTAINNNFIPFGHLLIVNKTDVAINATISSNDYILQLNNVEKKSINGWINYLSTDNNSFEGKNDVANNYLQSALTKTKLPYYGSFAIGLSRGECVLVGNNQVNTGTNGRFSRVNITNTADAGSNIETRNNIICDYLLQLTPSSDSKDAYVNAGYGVQTTGKVAGEDGWMVMTNVTENDSSKITTILPDLNFGVDNIMLSIKCYNNNCVAFYLSHDTNGDLDFGLTNENKLVHLADTDDNEAVYNLGMGLCEKSAPFMPMIFCSNDNVIDDNGLYVMGTYSNKDAKIFNLSSLNAQMISDWGNNQTIPTRQDKVTISDICSSFNFVDLNRKFSPMGFSNVTDEKSFILPKGSLDYGGNSAISSVAVRTNIFSETSDDGKRLVNDLQMDYLPAQKTFLGNALGFESLLSHDEFDPSVFERFSNNEPNYNNSDNYIINCNLGNIKGSNSATSRISRMVAVIPDSQLSASTFTNERSYQAKYPLPVDLNPPTEQNINNFNIEITTDRGTPATSIRHPSSFLFKIT